MAVLDEVHHMAEKKVKEILGGKKGGGVGDAVCGWSHPYGCG